MRLCHHPKTEGRQGQGEVHACCTDVRMRNKKVRAAGAKGDNAAAHDRNGGLTHETGLCQRPVDKSKERQAEISRGALLMLA